MEILDDSVEVAVEAETRVPRWLLTFERFVVSVWNGVYDLHLHDLLGIVVTWVVEACPLIP
jgi:hypothetical protein